MPCLYCAGVLCWLHLLRRGGLRERKPAARVKYTAGQRVYSARRGERTVRRPRRALQRGARWTRLRRHRCRARCVPAPPKSVAAGSTSGCKVASTDVQSAAGGARSPLPHTDRCKGSRKTGNPSFRVAKKSVRCSQAFGFCAPTCACRVRTRARKRRSSFWNLNVTSHLREQRRSALRAARSALRRCYTTQLFGNHPDAFVAGSVPKYSCVVGSEYCTSTSAPAASCR